MADISKIKFKGVEYNIKPLMDAEPTAGSTNAVQSGGVYDAIPAIDTTLTQSGQAADAKETGDRIEGAERRIVDVYGRTIPRITEWIEGEYIKREDGTVGTLASYHRTDYIEVTPNSFINFTCAGSYDVKYNAWYDASKEFISAFGTAQNASRDILVPANAKYMRLSFNKTTTNTIKLSDEASMLNLMAHLCEKNSLYLMPFNNTIYYFGQGIFGYTPTRIGTVTPVTAKTKLKISVDSGYKYSLSKFSSVIPSTSTEISSTGWITTDSVVNEGEIFLVNVAKTDDANISPSDGEHLRIYNEDYSERELEVVSSQFTKGYMNADGTLNANLNGVVSDIIINPLYVTASSTCRFLLSLYKNGEYIGKINNSGVMDKTAGNWKWFYGENDINQYLIDNGADSARITVAPTDSTTVTTETAQSYGEANVQVKRYKFVRLDYAERVFAKKQNENPVNYLVGPDLLKRTVSVTEMGALSYHQAFCRYNNKYYSIDGSNIAVQDDAFAVEQTTTLNTGHGNSLQLGSGGIAYASGWNDNKIYKVDLENLTVTDVITLPTTGYTTGVVDEVNNIAYIFQRESYPDTEANYNFIVYDITNHQLKSTKKILAFGAMQSADFFDDKIFVLNGLGTSACPNGYRVFDTDGNILAQYFIGAFSIEPEGVCVDRDTHELYISNVSKKVFKLTSD